MQLKAKAEAIATPSAQMKEELQEHSQSTEEAWASPALPITWGRFRQTWLTLPGGS